MAAKRIELKNSEVIFLEEPHEYWLGDKQLSGITGMIQRQLFPDEYDNVDEAVLNAAATYGTNVHASIEDFDKNWNNDGTVEVADYIEICKEHGLVHEASEYIVSDNKNWASMIDKVYRVSDDTFSIGDIKTYGVMTSEKLEKARWQLSLYAYFFELQNKKAKIDKLFIIHLRNKIKKDGTVDHINEVIFVNRIPSEICKELLEADLKEENFNNPFSIPEEYKFMEDEIRSLIQTKNDAEERLAEIKAKILSDMESSGVKTWTTETMRLTRKMPSTRISLNTSKLKAEHPEIDYQCCRKSYDSGIKATDPLSTAGRISEIMKFSPLSFYIKPKTMKYEIAISQIVKGENDITLTLNTANGGSIEIRSYGAKMNYEEFTEFADVIEGLRQKFTVITSKKESDDTAES